MAPSFSDCIPTSKLKTTREGEVLKRLPWDCSKLIRSRKSKDQAWQAFEENPTMIFFNNALYVQKNYQKVEIKAKINYENRLVKDLKSKSKPFYNYLKSKNQIKKSVDSLITDSGVATKTPLEASETLAEFFQSVFKPENYGPLPESCYSSRC